MASEPAVRVLVGVHVRREGAVVALRAQGAVEQRRDVRGDVDLRLVGHLRRGLVDVDERAVGVGEAHGHPRPREHPGAVWHPLAGPVVVVGVEADAVLALDRGFAGPVAPRDAMRAVRDGRRDAGPRVRELWELVRPILLERVRREVRAPRVEVQGDLEAGGLEGLGLRVREA